MMKLPEKLKNSTEISVGQVVLELLIKNMQNIVLLSDSKTLGLLKF